MAAIPSNEFRVWQRGPGFPVPQPPPPPPRPRNEQRPHRGATAIVPPFQQPTIPGTDPGPPWMRPRGQRDASARNQWGMYGGRPSQGEDEVRPPPVDLQATLLNNPPNVMTNVMDVQYHVPGHDARADARRLAEARRIMDSHQEERPPWPPAPHATDVDTDAGFAPFNPVVAEPPWPRNFHMPCPHRGAQDSWPSAAGPHSGGQWVGPMWGPDPGPCSSWSPMPYHPASPGPPRDAAQAEQYSGYRSFHAPPHPPRGPPSHDRHDGTRMGRMQQHELLSPRTGQRRHRSFAIGRPLRGSQNRTRLRCGRKRVTQFAVHGIISMTVAVEDPAEAYAVEPDRRDGLGDRSVVQACRCAYQKRLLRRG
eukprot:5509403-Amphidinium_carterae.1